MDARIDTKLTLAQNAAKYYELAKKHKGKLAMIESIIAKARKDLETLEAKELDIAVSAKKPIRERAWFEKFRWFISSEGFLCIGGRDATSNDIIVKKHASAHDRIFHAEMAGSPFFIVQTQGKEPGEATLEEAAQATASFSRAWKQGLSFMEVFCVLPEQVSKEAKAGEYLGKGAFMIYGKKTTYRPTLGLAIGADAQGRVQCAPLSAVRSQCEKVLVVSPGKDRPSDAARYIHRHTGAPVDEIVRSLPPGGVRLSNPDEKRERKY